MYGNSSPKKIQRRLFPGKNTFDLDIGKIHGFPIVQIDANESFDRPFEFLPLSSFPFERLHFKTIQKIHACKRITRVVLANNASLIVILHCDRMFASHKRKRGITRNPRSLRTTLLRNMIIRLAGLVWKELFSCGWENWKRCRGEDEAASLVSINEPPNNSARNFN